MDRRWTGAVSNDPDDPRNWEPAGDDARTVDGAPLVTGEVAHWWADNPPGVENGVWRVSAGPRGDGPEEGGGGMTQEELAAVLLGVFGRQLQDAFASVRRDEREKERERWAAAALRLRAAHQAAVAGVREEKAVRFAVGGPFDPTGFEVREEREWAAAAALGELLAEMEGGAP